MNTNEIPCPCVSGVLMNGFCYRLGVVTIDYQRNISGFSVQTSGDAAYLGFALQYSDEWQR
jgi:hypothetical protein